MPQGRISFEKLEGIDMTADLVTEKAQAAAWFETLRDQIVTAFEGLETSHTDGPTADFCSRSV